MVNRVPGGEAPQLRAESCPRAPPPPRPRAAGQATVRRACWWCVGTVLQKHSECDLAAAYAFFFSFLRVAVQVFRLLKSILLYLSISVKVAVGIVLHAHAPSQHLQVVVYLRTQLLVHGCCSREQHVVWYPHQNMLAVCKASLSLTFDSMPSVHAHLMHLIEFSANS